MSDPKPSVAERIEVDPEYIAGAIRDRLTKDGYAESNLHIDHVEFHIETRTTGMGMPERDEHVFTGATATIRKR